MSLEMTLRPPRPWKDVLRDWVAELSLKLGRPEADLLEKGLSVYDFSPERHVEIRYPFGCTHKVSAAFVVVRPLSRLAAVFSEHAGYLEFELIEDCAVVEIREDIYWQG